MTCPISKAFQQRLKIFLLTIIRFILRTQSNVFDKSRQIHQLIIQYHQKTGLTPLQLQCLCHIQPVATKMGSTKLSIQLPAVYLVWMYIPAAFLRLHDVLKLMFHKNMYLHQEQLLHMSKYTQFWGGERRIQQSYSLCGKRSHRRCLLFG